MPMGNFAMKMVSLLYYESSPILLNPFDFSDERRIAEKEKTFMQQTSRNSRLGLLGSLLGAVLTVLSIFLPLILTEPVLDTRFSDPYPPTLDGVWMLRSLASQSRVSSEVSVYIPMLLVLALFTLGTSSVLLFLQDNPLPVVNWIRTLTTIGALIVLLWFIEGVEGLNFVEAGLPPAKFSLGLGTVMVEIGIALSALGLGLVGIGAMVGVGLGYLFFFSPFAKVDFFITPLTCLLGALIGWRIQRAASKKARVGTMVRGGR